MKKFDGEISKFCIIDIGGKQILCSKGQKILVDLIKGAEKGQKVNMKVVFNSGQAVTSTVECIIEEPLVLGEKVIIYKTRRRKGYERKNGFRPKYTKIIIGGE